MVCQFKGQAKSWLGFLKDGLEQDLSEKGAVYSLTVTILQICLSKSVLEPLLEERK